MKAQSFSTKDAVISDNDAELTGDVISTTNADILHAHFVSAMSRCTLLYKIVMHVQNILRNLR